MYLVKDNVKSVGKEQNSKEGCFKSRNKEVFDQLQSYVQTIAAM